MVLKIVTTIIINGAKLRTIIAVLCGHIVINFYTLKGEL